MTEKQMLVQHFYNAFKQSENANKLLDSQMKELGEEVKVDMSSVKHMVLFRKLNDFKNIDQLKTFIKNLPGDNISEETIDYIFENAVMEKDGYVHIPYIPTF